MKNIYLLVIFTTITIFCKAQSDTIVRYIDSNWVRCDISNATYVAKIYYSNKRWYKEYFELNSNTLVGKNVYLDKELKIPVDTSIGYYPDKSVGLSIYSKGKLVKEQLTSSSNKLIRFAIFNKDGEIIEQKGYDENGNEIPNYIYRRAASFPGGQNVWQEYLKMNMDNTIPVKHGAIPGQYGVTVSFLIDKDGSVTEVKALNNPGYGSEEEAVRVIENSPKWNPAIQYNKPVTYRQKQRIIFTVQ